MLFTAPTAFAAPFNTDPQDCATGAIGNATTNTGVPTSWAMSCQNWNLTSVPASAGDTIKVHVYFHNTSSNPATNVTIRLSQSPSSGASNNFNFAGVLGSDQGSIPFNLSTNISTSQTLSVVSATLAKTQANLSNPTSVSASQIMSSGLNIGTVGTGWANQGDLVVTFRVGNTVVNNCTLTSFQANPTSINSGGSTTLSWTSTGCTSVTIPGVGTFTNTNSNTTVSPSNTTTYSATGGPSGNTLSTTVSVNSVSACYITSFSASPTYINSGQSSTLYWSTTGATNVTISSLGTFGPTDSRVVYPTSTTTYTLTANCINGTTAVQTVIVTVNGNNNGTNPSVRTDSPTGVDEESATLRGYANGNGSLIDAWLEFPCRGTRYDYTYGVSNTNLSYNISSLSPNTTYYYCAAAQNSYSGQIIRGREVSFRTDDNNNNNNNLDVTTNPATSIGKTYATINGYVDGNGNSTTTWFRYGTSTGAMTMYTSTVNNGSGAGNTSAYLSNLAPNTTYYFQAVANNSASGTVNGNIKNFNTDASVINNSSTSVVTTIATNVSRNNATLNGILLDTSNLSTNVYFEYGTTVNLGARTNSKNLGSGTSLPFNEYISNLAPNTIYFFRAMANNSNGTVMGNIEIFRTPGTAVTPTPPVNPPQVDSKIMLKIENRYQFVSVGDTIDYTITYQNISKTKITKPLLQVIVPRYVAYLNSSRGTFAVETNTLNVQVEDLAPGAGGVVYLQGRVLSLPENNADIVTTAYIAYTNGSGAQDSAMAYVLNTPRAVNNLTASAFGAGFFPSSLCGWLLWVVIILLILWALREIFRSRNMRNNYYYNNAQAVPPRPINANPAHTDSQGVPHT